jgi:energy-coupling factor transporter transmembrane protein EcfT
MASAKSSGISFFSLLTILFIGLKLLNKIDWSWFWVLSPTILPIILILCSIIIGGIFSSYSKKKKLAKHEIMMEEMRNKHKSHWEKRMEEVSQKYK